jgi:hypothetical protein
VDGTDPEVTAGDFAMSRALTVLLSERNALTRVLLGQPSDETAEEARPGKAGLHLEE